MSAITVARLDYLRVKVLSTARGSAELNTYCDALTKAPRLVVAGHLVRAGGQLLALAVAHAVGRGLR